MRYKRSDGDLLAAARLYDEANDHALAMLRRQMHKWRNIVWWHGDHTRSGVVLEVCGSRYDTARLRVKTPTGAVVYIYASRVIRIMRGIPK